MLRRHLRACDPRAAERLTRPAVQALERQGYGVTQSVDAWPERGLEVFRETSPPSASRWSPRPAPAAPEMAHFRCVLRQTPQLKADSAGSHGPFLSPEWRDLALLRHGSGAGPWIPRACQLISPPSKLDLRRQCREQIQAREIRELVVRHDRIDPAVRVQVSGASPTPLASRPTRPSASWRAARTPQQFSTSRIRRRRLIVVAVAGEPAARRRRGLSVGGVMRAAPDRARFVPGRSRSSATGGRSARVVVEVRAHQE
jgi:hypothetical protein